eukprot:TRINITY_DN2786_c0_g1_i1.p1 TRINITY_DN2786_c0_g1~~TRINITY_DN2786_c0_g1_i1.p1  ORF type:complete len:273 (-),score=24.68 TRINITY_DN2786_c0_g1_i1:321-1139(-)
MDEVNPFALDSDEGPPDFFNPIDTYDPFNETQSYTNEEAPATFIPLDEEVKEDPSVDYSKYKCWHVDYWKYWFNVDTNDILWRCLFSLIPFNPSFLERITEKPDLWGPIWVTTTLVAILAVSSNIGSFLTLHEASLSTEGIFKLLYGAMVIYGYTFIIPLILMFVCKWLKIPLKFPEAASLYGYSMVIFLPIGIACIIPIVLVRYILMGVAGLVSTLFLSYNFWIKTKDHFDMFWVIVITIAIMHVALTVVFTLYFFNAPLDAFTNITNVTQ